LWVGRTLGDLINLQWKRNGCPLSMQDVAHPMRTLQMREFARQPKYDWSNFLRSVQEGESIDNVVKGIKQLSMRCTRIAEKWSKTYPGRALATPEEQAEWMRRPDLIKP